MLAYYSTNDTRFTNFPLKGKSEPNLTWFMYKENNVFVWNDGNLMRNKQKHSKYRIVLPKTSLGHSFLQKYKLVGGDFIPSQYVVLLHTHGISAVLKKRAILHYFWFMLKIHEMPWICNNNNIEWP